MSDEIQYFVIASLARNTLDRDLDIVRQTLIAQHKYPEATQDLQFKEVKFLTKLFQALLHAKSRQERIQEICNDHSSNTQYSSTSPTHNTPRRISIRNILQQQISGGRKRNRHRRKKEGYVESGLGKHETKGW